MAIKDRLPSAEEFIESLPISKDFLARLGILAGQTTRKISIDSVALSSGTLSDVEISKVNLGNASIGTINIENVSASLKQSSAILENVRAILELDFTLIWKVDLGWLGHWGDTNNLGSIDIPIDLGNISIPDLDNIDLTIPKVDIPSVVAEMKPITNLQLGAFSLTSADIDKLTLPSAGLNLTGMGVGDVSISSLSVPGVSSKAIGVAGAQPELSIDLPGATVQNLSIPSVSIPEITSASFDTAATASAKNIEVNLGILKITLRVTPTIHLDVGLMKISDAQLDASIGSVDINDISLPVSIQGLSASAFEAQGISVNKITF